MYHYRDNTGLEVDAIVELAPDRWAGFEIKLGIGRVDEAAANLLRFAERVDTEAVGRPAALGVIVGSGYGYRREDGGLGHSVWCFGAVGVPGRTRALSPWGVRPLRPAARCAG